MRNNGGVTHAYASLQARSHRARPTSGPRNRRGHLHLPDWDDVILTEDETQEACDECTQQGRGCTHDE